MQSRGERILTALQQVPQLPVSPFNSTHWNSSTFLDCVVAFEVDWSSIVGLDYSYPLCQDGRLVLEAAQVSKREFASVKLLEQHALFLLNLSGNQNS